MAESEPRPPKLDGIEVMGLLGTGVTSRVYLANQDRFNRPVAVKVLESGTVGSGTTELLRDEARFLAVLSAHPNILTLYDAGVTSDGLTYLVTEFLPAGSYAQRVRSEGLLEWGDVVRVGIKLAGALETSHLHGVVHGDVKPDNVLIGRVGQPLLGDFGVAVLLTRLQVAEQALLTPLHAAPELFGGAPGSVLADVYALGSTLQTLLTGQSPAGSASDSPAAIVARMGRGERLSLDAAEAPSDLAELLERLTATDPSARPASAAEMGMELQEIQRRHGLGPTEMDVMSELPATGEASVDPGWFTANPAEVTAPPPDPDRPSDSHRVLEAALVPDPALAPDPTPVPDPTRDENQRTASPRRKGLLVAAGAMLSLSMIALFVWSQIGGDSSAPTGSDAAPEVDQDADGGADRSVSVPQSDVAGIQPGVVFGHPDLADTSARLASTLSEESIIFGQLPGLPVPRPYYGVALHSLPATFHYQAYNTRLPETCSGMMSRGITVVGLWERMSLWPGGVMLVAVAEAKDEVAAHELATVISLEVGVDPDACHGIGVYNVSDYSDYGVEHRDIETRLSEDVTYNVWRQQDLTVGAQTWPESTRLVAEVDQFVIDISLVTEEVLPADNDRVVATIVNQIRNRLAPSD